MNTIIKLSPDPTIADPHYLDNVNARNLLKALGDCFRIKDTSNIKMSDLEKFLTNYK